MSAPFGAGLVPRRSLTEPVLLSDSSASYLDFIRISASGGSLTGGRPGEVGSLSNIHLPSSDQALCENPLRTGHRKKRGSNMASQKAHILICPVYPCHLDLSSVPLPRDRGAQAGLLVHVVTIIDATVLTAS